MKIIFLPVLKCLGLFTFCFLIARNGQAQNSSKSRFEDSITKDFCEVFAQTSLKIDKENFKMELGMLIIPLFTKYKDQIKSEWELDISNGDDIGKAGEKMGQIAVLNCPAFLNFVKNNLNTVAEVDKPEGKRYTGRLIKVEGTPFTYLLVQNKAGKTEKFYWMEYFEGADKLSAQANLVLNKEIAVSYNEMEAYQLSAKEYKSIKVITKIEFNK